MKVMQMFLQFYNYKPNTKSPNSLLIGFSEQRKNVNVISKKTSLDICTRVLLLFISFFYFLT